MYIKHINNIYFQKLVGNGAGAINSIPHSRSLI